MKHLVKCGAVFLSWILFVLLVHEINNRPVIYTIEYSDPPVNWYRIVVEMKGRSGTVSLKNMDQKETINFFSWENFELEDEGQAYITLGTTGKIDTSYIIDHIKVTSEWSVVEPF